MAINKLTSKFCDTAPKGNHFDGEGLYLLVQADGKKYWRMVCYLNGKRKLLAFGAYPKVSLAKARIARVQAQELIAQGIDPVQHSKSIRKLQAQNEIYKNQADQNTFEQIARQLDASKQGKITEEARHKMVRQLEIHVFPVIGHKNIDDIEGRELLALFQSVAEKTNHGRPMTYMAGKLCQWSAEIFDFAHMLNQNFMKNPCRIIIKHLPKHKTKNMKRIKPEKVSDFLNDLKAYNGHPLTKASIWMLLYTGMRQASIRRAVWQDFDLNKMIWSRSPEKGDERIHYLPLPSQSILLIAGIKSFIAMKPDTLVFPSVYNPYHPMSEGAICQALKRMGYDMVGHGIRGLVSTSLNEKGYPPHIVEAQLGHKTKSIVEAAYNHATYFDERKKMMQEWADYLDSLV